MKKSIFEIRDIFYDMDNSSFDPLLPIGRDIESDRGSLRILSGSLGEQRKMERKFRSEGAAITNRYIGLESLFTLRENLLRSGRADSDIEALADELGIAALLNSTTMCLPAFQQEKAAVALAVLSGAREIGLFNACLGLSHGEKLGLYSEMDAFCKNHGLTATLFIPKNPRPAAVSHPTAVGMPV